MGGREEIRAHSNDAETKVKADFACATIQDGPFVEIDEPAKPAIGEYGDKRRHYACP